MAMVHLLIKAMFEEQPTLKPGLLKNTAPPPTTPTPPPSPWQVATTSVSYPLPPLPQPPFFNLRGRTLLANKPCNHTDFYVNLCKSHSFLMKH